jgi:putative membrane protein
MRLARKPKSDAMSDLLSLLYPWTKTLHLLSVFAWMAGLFYLPRLFVYHTEAVEAGGETDSLFQTMEMKLLRYIMNPAMISSWVFGLILVLTPGVVDWGSVWPYTKAAAILAMTWFHMWCAARRKAFVAGTNDRTGRQYRIMNEVPTLLLIVIVVSVIVRPF